MKIRRNSGKTKVTDLVFVLYVFIPVGHAVVVSDRLVCLIGSMGCLFLSNTDVVAGNALHSVLWSSGSVDDDRTRLSVSFLLRLYNRHFGL